MLMTIRARAASIAGPIHDRLIVYAVDATARQRSAPLTVAEDGDRILGR
jgi:hypothetical protein